MYVPVAQASDAGLRTAHSYFQVNWVVKAAGFSPELTQRIREELRAVDSRLPITGFRSMDEIRARAMANETFQMTLLTTFAIVGLLLAAAGLYGLVTYNVAQRTREFGIRLALGATRNGVLLLVLRQALLLSAAGAVLGLLAAVFAGRAVQSFVFGVSTVDLGTFTGVAAVLVAVTLVASCVPAIRATRLNPVTALRE
jgi:ABC-type antimicrobial peptide transport system permease subunit